MTPVKIADINHSFDRARVVAMRWDLVPFALVFDMDVVMDEGREDIHRSWLVLSGVYQFNLAFEPANIPLGFWIQGLAAETRRDQTRVQFSAQIAFSSGGQPKAQWYHFEADAKRVLYLLSVESCRWQNDWQSLSYDQRQGLASDAEMRAEAGNHLDGKFE